MPRRPRGVSRIVLEAFISSGSFIIIIDPSPETPFNVCQKISTQANRDGTRAEASMHGKYVRVQRTDVDPEVIKWHVEHTLPTLEPIPMFMFYQKLQRELESKPKPKPKEKSGRKLVLTLESLDKRTPEEKKWSEDMAAALKQARELGSDYDVTWNSEAKKFLPVKSKEEAPKKREDLSDDDDWNDDPQFWPD